MQEPPHVCQIKGHPIIPHFPLNFGSQTASKAGFSLPMPLFVKLSMWRGTINNLRNGQQPLDFTPYKQATKRFWASHLAESRVRIPSPSGLAVVNQMVDYRSVDSQGSTWSME